MQIAINNVNSTKFGQVKKHGHGKSSFETITFTVFTSDGQFLDLTLMSGENPTLPPIQIEGSTQPEEPSSSEKHPDKSKRPI